MWSLEYNKSNVCERKKDSLGISWGEKDMVNSFKKQKKNCSFGEFPHWLGGVECWTSIVK